MKRDRPLLAFVLSRSIALAVFGSCGNEPQPPVVVANPPASESPLEQPMRNIAYALAELEFRVRAIEGAGGKLPWPERSSPAVLATGSEGFSFAGAGPWALPVRLKNVEPFGDGQKITLSVGNPYAAELRNLKLEVEYGTRPPIPNESDAESTAHAEWSRGLKRLEQPVPNDLGSGSWSPVSFTIAPAKPEDVAFMRVTVQVGRVGLQSE